MLKLYRRKGQRNWRVRGTVHGIYIDRTCGTGARKEAEEKRKLLREVEKQDFIWLMQDRRGRRIVWRLLEKAGVFRTTFRPDALEMAFNEGIRNVGLLLVTEIHELCPEKYHVMAKETTDNDDRS